MELSNSQIQDTLFRTILDHSPAAIVFVDEHATVKVWNQGAERMFGISKQQAIGKNFHDVACSPELVFRERQRFHDSAGLDPQNATSWETKVTISGGRQLWVDQTMLRFELLGQLWAYFEIRDADSRKRRETELQREATTDELSQLENRRGFQRRLEANLQNRLTLGIIDIDHFKEINDRFGHEWGDEAIRLVATRLREISENMICIARLGGDEFGVAITTTSPEIVQQCFETFRETIASSRFLPDQQGITISIGVARSDQPDVSSRDLLTTADRALYRSKQAGRNRVTVASIRS